MKKFISGIIASAIMATAMMSASASVAVNSFDSAENPAKGNADQYFDITNIDGCGTVNAEKAIWSCIKFSKDFEQITGGTVVLESAFSITGTGISMDHTGNVTSSNPWGGPIVFSLQDYDDFSSTTTENLKFAYGPYVASSKFNDINYASYKDENDQSLLDKNANQVLLDTDGHGRKAYIKTVINLDDKTEMSYFNWDGSNTWRPITSKALSFEQNYINRLQLSLIVPKGRKTQIDYIKLYKEEYPDSPVVNDTFDNGETWIDAGYTIINMPGNKVTYNQNGKRYIKRLETLPNDAAKQFIYKYPLTDGSFSSDKVVVDFEFDPYLKNGTKANSMGDYGIWFRDENSAAIVRINCGNSGAEAWAETAAGGWGTKQSIGIPGLWGGVSIYQETTPSKYRAIFDYSDGTFDFYKANAAGIYRKLNKTDISFKATDGSMPKLKYIAFSAYNGQASFDADTQVDLYALDNFNVYTIPAGKTVSDIGVFDSNDVAITEAAAGQSIKVTVGASAYESEAPVTVVAALYGADGTFKGTEYQTDNLTYMQEIDSYLLNCMNYTVPQNAVSGDYVKLMVWDDMNSITPYREAATITIK